MLNKKVVFGLLASFVLVSPVSAQSVNGGEINQFVDSDTRATGGSVSVTTTDQKAYLDQYNKYGNGYDINAGNINQFADIDTSAFDRSISVTETNQDAYLEQDSYSKPYHPYYNNPYVH